MTSIRFFKEPFSAGSHFFGFLLGIVGLVVLVVLSASDGPKVAGMSIYGGTLIALFLASSVYHFVDMGEQGNRWLRRIDHAAIFLFIAGSYVPPLIHLLGGTWRITMLALVGSLALIGCIVKTVWTSCPIWLSTLLYVGLGWLALIPAPLIVPQLTWPALAWLVGGGFAYTVGAVVYVRRWPDPWPTRGVGHHEIWHLLVLAGAASHFMFAVYLLDFVYPPF